MFIVIFVYLLWYNGQLYVFGGQNTVDNNVWVTRDYGNSWSIMPATYSLALAYGESWIEASTTCSAMAVSATASGTSYSYQKELVSN